MAAIPSYSIKQLTSAITIEKTAYLTQSAQLTLEQLKKIPREQWIISANQQHIMASPHGDWQAFELINNNLTYETVIIEIDRRSPVSYSPFYTEDQFGNFVEYPLIPQSTNYYYTRLSIPAGQSLTFYIKLTSAYTAHIGIRVNNPVFFIEKTSVNHSITGLTVGIVIGFALIQLLLYLGSGYQGYLLLTGFFIARSLLLASLMGWNIGFFYPDYPELKANEFPILTAISTVFLLAFVSDLFNIKQLHKKLYHTLLILCLGIIIFIPGSLLLSPLYNIFGSLVLYLCATLIVCCVTYLLIKQQVRLAPLLAWLCGFEILFVVLIIIGISWADSSLFDYRRLIYALGFIVNGLTITYLIGRRVYYLNKDRISAQQHALEQALQAKQAQEQLIALQQQTHESMEQKIQERTLELNIALQELELANQELERKNMLDELTGLFNRRFYDQRIVAEYRRSKRNLTPLSLVILDIDFFKKINDNYGHLAGDYCIEQVAKIIKDSLKRSTDVGCRYGGEEFCLILPDTTPQGAVELAERIRKAVEKTSLEYQEYTIQFTISCGIATYTQQPNMTPDELFAAADAALYYAKEHGRNQVHLHQDNTLSQEKNS
jgi:diguanylate cyclase (GGDEF)-like protein